MATLHFALAGNPKSDGTYNVKLRYTSTTRGKTNVFYISTGVFLYKQQFDLLKSGTLKGATYAELLAIKQKYEHIIVSLQQKNKPITKDTVEAHVVKDHQIDHTINLDLWFANFIESKQRQQTSNKSYVWSFNLLKEAVGPTGITPYVMCDKDFVRYFEKWLIDRNYSPIYIKNVITFAKMYINYVGQHFDLPTVKHKVTPLHHEQYHLTADDVQRLRQPYNNKKYKVYNVIHQMVQINLELGLRVSELMQLRKLNVTLHDTYATIRIHEVKKQKSREVIAKDTFQLIKHLTDNTQDYLFDIYRNTTFVSEKFKKYLQQRNFTEMKIHLNKNGYNVQEIETPLYDLITFHALRRWAINNKIKRYGLKVAQAYSGHASLTTLEKYYLTDLTADDLVKLLQNEKGHTDFSNDHPTL